MKTQEKGKNGSLLKRKLYLLLSMKENNQIACWHTSKRLSILYGELNCINELLDAMLDKTNLIS